MIDPRTVLVAGDADERRTRETYNAWMLRGLEVAESLARQPERAGWPDDDPPADLPPAQWTRRPYDGTAVAAALAHGWLVATPADAAGAVDPDPATAPLYGLAVGVKDIIDVAGMPTRNGTAGVVRTDPAASAACWSALAAAGARCVGKTATHEMAWGVTTPQISHPLADDRIAGGSSGGSAACVAAGAAQGALGTDTGGSIRIPAALCGVVGFRPTTGAVPTSGVTPLAPDQDVPGPLATDVPTCVAMLEVLLGRGLGLGYDGPRLDGLRIGVLARPGRLEAGVRRAYESALGGLADAGARLVPCETAAHREAASVSLLTMLISSARLYAASVYAAPTEFGGEARALLTIGETVARDVPLVDAARAAVRAETARTFGDAHLDAFVTPTVPCTAPRRGSAEVRIEDRDEPVASALTRFTAWASVAAMPAISVPFPTPGLPAGVQVMAPPGHEHVCARVALGIEAANLDSDANLRCDE